MRKLFALFFLALVASPAISAPIAIAYAHGGDDGADHDAGDDHGHDG